MERKTTKTKARAQKGKWNGGRVPLRYDCVRGDQLPVPNAEEQKVVEAVFALVIAHRSLSKVRRELAALGYRTKVRTIGGPDGQQRQVGGNRFSYDAIKSVVENPVYKGLVRHRDQLYPGRARAAHHREGVGRGQRRPGPLQAPAEDGWPHAQRRPRPPAQGHPQVRGLQLHHGAIPGTEEEPQRPAVRLLCLYPGHRAGEEEQVQDQEPARPLTQCQRSRCAAFPAAAGKQESLASRANPIAAGAYADSAWCVALRFGLSAPGRGPSHCEGCDGRVARGRWSP